MNRKSNLALVVNNMPVSTAAHPRLIVIEYSGGAGDRNARATTLDGAVRSSVLRVAQRQYTEARVYDCRFGSKSLAFTVRASITGLAISWSHKPKWGRV